MNLAALRSEVAACRAWERALHGGSPGMRRAAAMPGRQEFILPLLMPLYGLIAWITGARFEAEWLIAVIPWWRLFFLGRLFPMSMPSEWEALRLPSKRGWLLARWSLRLPGLAWLGLCTLAHHSLIALRDTPHPEGIRWTLVAALLLAPLLLEVLAAWFPFQERAFGGKGLLAPMFALLLALLFLGIAVTVRFTVESEPGEVPGVSVAIAALGLIVLALTLPSLAVLRKRAARLSGTSGVSLMIRHGLVGMAGVTPALAFGIGLFLPSALVVGHGDQPLVALGPILLALFAGGITVVAAHAVRLVEIMDIGIEPRPEVTAPRPILVAPIHDRSGGGLRAAAWALYRGRWRTLQHPWLAFLPKFLWECRGPVCGLVAVAFVAYAPSRGGWGLGGLYLGFASLTLVPSHLRLPASRRFHFLGGDFTAVALHNLRWGILLAVTPAALGGAFLFSLKDAPPFVSLAGAWAGAVGFLLLREGAGITALFPGFGRGYFALIACVIGGWFLDPSISVGIGGSVLLGVALYSTVLEFRNPVSAGARLAATADDD